MTLVPWRIFVNRVDSYHGKKFVEVLPGREATRDEGRSGDPGDVRENERRATGEEKRRNPARAEDDEDDDAAGDDEEEENLYERKVESRKYEVVGTAEDDKYERPEDVAAVVPSGNKELLLDELMKCGVVIYDITQDDSQISEARWALEGILSKLEKCRRDAPRAFERSRETRRFVLISTLMTWAMTKPLNTEEPDAPFTEADYRKRKAHPNFREHLKCERDVLTAPRRANLHDKLKTIVVGAGVTYGDEEGPIHWLFRSAWMNADSLPILGRGTNKIPLLYVRDLVEVVSLILQKWPKPKYIVACEQELVSQATIVKKISKALATGKVRRVVPEEAFLLPEMSQRTYDILNADVNVEPAYVVDNALRWHWDTPFRDNVDAVVSEYKTSRNLLPVRIVVVGPPASGKTRLARSLAKHYGIHYISVENVVKETIEKLSKEIQASAASVSDIAKRESSRPELEEVEDDDEDDDGDDDEDVRGAQTLQEQLDEIRDNLAVNNERLDDDILNKILRRRLDSHDCQNQGYVMDGYPKTLRQARGLFGSGDAGEDVAGDEDEDEDDFLDTSVGGGNRRIIPELVVALEAGDEFLIERVTRLPEREIQGTRYTEEAMLRRLRKYRERNTDDESPLDFFDELEVHPLVIPVEEDVCPEMFTSLVRCIDRLGEPRNYGPTDAEREDARRRAEAEALATSAIEEARRAREDLERKMARQKKMMEWTDLLEKLKQEEAEQLSVLCEPLRHYLVRYIFPTLSQGLIEVARVRPDDPIDFLAEYLFKENPGGRMFEPDYTETMSALLSAIERLQEDILPVDDALLDKGTLRYLRPQGRRRGDSCRKSRTSANEPEVLTEDDDDSNDRIGCDGRRMSRTRGISSRVDATKSDDGRTSGVRDDEEIDDAVAASSFSYEEIDEGESFGNSTTRSLENSQ